MTATVILQDIGPECTADGDLGQAIEVALPALASEIERTHASAAIQEPSARPVPSIYHRYRPHQEEDT